jgi:hypothetical protein
LETMLTSLKGREKKRERRKEREEIDIFLDRE